MVQPTPSYVSYEDFLEAELRSSTKHEWLDGVVYDMAGGSLEHSRLAMNVTAALKIAFPKCTVFQSDAMILVRATGLSTYADGVVVCGEIDKQKVERNRRVIGEALVNPTVIVEVLSDSTEAYDRGEKFAHYMRIPSLREYVLVSQDTRRIEVFRRPKHGRWDLDAVTAGDIRILDSKIRVDDVY
ncbi:MAG: Uma2 family endonuclease [Polyangiaceae bacterium]|nr:Uma2 family endonuclease [Polyangiaceae bacterium]